MSTPLRPPVSAGNNSAESKNNQKKQGPWETEMLKFINKLVEVEYVIGERTLKATGYLRAFAGMGMHVVLDETHKSVFVRIPLSITRLRKGVAEADAA